MAQVLFVQEDEGTVVVDALAAEPLTARARLPGGVLGSIVGNRLHDWAERSATVRWEVLNRYGGRLRLDDGRTVVTLDLVQSTS